MMSLTGEPDGDPQKVGIAISDIGAGMWAAFAVMSAIITGSTAEGQYIDVSMLDGQVAWLTYQAGYLFRQRQATQARLGARTPTSAPTRRSCARTASSSTSQSAPSASGSGSARPCNLEELGKPDYATNGDRVNNRSVLVPYLQQVFLTRPVAEWVADLQKVSVPCGAINDLADVFADPQIEARDMLQEMLHPVAGKIKQTGIPIKFSRTPGGLDLPPPLLGEHNREILAGLGYSDGAIESLKQREVI